MPEPHPETVARTANAKSRKTVGRHRLRRGIPTRNRPLIATPVESDSQGNRFTVLTLVAAIATVSDVGNAVGPVGVILAGANVHVAPAGMPPVHAKVIVEWNPSSGVVVSTTGPEVPPWAIVAEEPEEEKVNVPTEARIFNALPVEMLGR